MTAWQTGRLFRLEQNAKEHIKSIICSQFETIEIQ